MEPGDRYTTFENLDSELKDIKETCSKLFSENWEENFEAITELRSYTKYNFEEFKHYWTYLRPRIMQVSFSLRSFLSKNSLMLLSELFSQPRPEMTPTDILESLLNKSSSEKSFLKSEILTAISNICQNFLNLEIFKVILQQTFSKSSGIAKISLKLVEKHIEKLGPSDKFEVLLMLEEGKRQEHQILGKKVFTELQLTWPEFKESCEKLSENRKKWLLGLSKEKISEKPSLKALISQSKKIPKENSDIFINE